MTAQELLEWYANGERNFQGVNLSGADLREAYLREADLQGADLRWTDLQGADLRWTDLRWTDLRWADLQGADLRWTDLRWTDLRWTDLTKNCLDPMTVPNGDITRFQTINSGRWCVGYRTKNSPVIGGPKYTPGELRTTPVFSTADTECHPGISVLPTKNEAGEYARGEPIVKVIFRPWDCHQAGGKWRVRELIVWEDM